MKKKKKVNIDVQERTYIFYRTDKTSDKDPDKTSYTIEIEKRHYCTHCGRKRDESFMKIVGAGAFGKKRWACDDDTRSCLAIRKIKKGF